MKLIPPEQLNKCKCNLCVIQAPSLTVLFDMLQAVCLLSSNVSVFNKSMLFSKTKLSYFFSLNLTKLWASPGMFWSKLYLNQMYNHNCSHDLRMRTCTRYASVSKRDSYMVCWRDCYIIFDRIPRWCDTVTRTHDNYHLHRLIHLWYWNR